MAILPSREAWERVRRAVHTIEGDPRPGTARGRRRNVPPSSIKLVKHDEDVTAGNSASFALYEDIDAAGTWVATGDEITVLVELGDYTADNKAYAARIAGRWRILQTECAEE